MQEVKQFLIATVDNLRKPSWCWLCGKLIKVGSTVAICRYGNCDGDWEKAHEQCAKDSPFNAETESIGVSGGLTIVWRELDDYVGRYRYGIFIDNTEVLRTTARDKAEGVKEFLEAWPQMAGECLALASLK